MKSKCMWCDPPRIFDDDGVDDGWIAEGICSKCRDRELREYADYIILKRLKEKEGKEGKR